MIDSEWESHEQTQSHLEKHRSVSLQEDKAPASGPSVTRLQVRAPDKRSDPTHPVELQARSAEEFLPDSFFDVSIEVQEDDDAEPVVLNEGLSEDRRVELESEIRNVIQKRQRQSENVSDDDEDDLDWRRKKL